jgi:hypothetical protein
VSAAAGTRVPTLSVPAAGGILDHYPVSEAPMRHPILAIAPLVLILALVLAPSAQGAGASDLVGSWRVDGDATWATLSKSAAIAKQLAGLSPEMVEQIKTTMLSTIAGTTYQFTTDKLISVSNGVRREERYTITASNGAVLTADCIDDQGKKSQSSVTVAKDHLEITNTANPDEVVSLIRVK